MDEPSGANYIQYSMGATFQYFVAFVLLLLISFMIEYGHLELAAWPLLGIPLIPLLMIVNVIYTSLRIAFTLKCEDGIISWRGWLRSGTCGVLEVRDVRSSLWLLGDGSIAKITLVDGTGIWIPIRYGFLEFFDCVGMGVPVQLNGLGYLRATYGAWSRCKVVKRNS